MGDSRFRRVDRLPQRWRRGEWAAVLAEGQAEAEIEATRRHTYNGQPWGSEAFVAGLEKQTGRYLRSCPMGRPRKLGAPQGVS
jgi:hypothetical protein